MLVIDLFGTPRVRRDETEIRFDTRKAVALLAVLAVTGREQSRDALGALLWPELDRSRARSALRRTLSVAAASVPELSADMAAVRLDLDAIECDVVEFRRRADSDETGDWARAVELATGEFLEGFALRDSPAFDEWATATAEGLRDDLALLLGMLATAAARDGDHRAALGYARRRVAIEPLSEPAHVDVIRMSAWSGDRPGSLQAYRELVRVLDEELGVAPLPATTALHDAIRGGTMLAAPHDRRVPSASAASSEVIGQLVAAAAVIGAPADADLIRLVAGRDETEVTAALADAVRAGLLTQEGGDYRVADALVAATAVAELPLARRRLLHGRAAEVLARRAGADPDGGPAELVGLHLADAGRDHEAAAWFIRGAEAAARRSAYDDALEAWRSALAVGRDTVAVHVALGTTLVRLGRYAEALVALGRAAERAGDDGAALAAAREALGLAELQGDLHGIAALRSHLADLLHAAGRDDDAMAEQRRWAEAFAEVSGAGPGPASWTLSEW